MPAEHLGKLLSTVRAPADHGTELYERGLIVKNAGGAVEASFDFPKIGRPRIVTGGAASRTSLLSERALLFRTGGMAMDAAESAVRSALDGKLGLLPAGQETNAVPMTFGAAQRLGNPDASTAATHYLPISAELRDRQLYDIAIRDDAGRWQVVAPNSVYPRAQWTDFGLAHITDIHVARRIDTFRTKLRQLGREDGAKNMVNWNDRFRGFIKYANYMHRIGVLDVIIATGDLYDYIYEKGEGFGNGNADFFRALLLGQAPGPDFPNERLQVPIFLTAGNHDFRKHAYEILFDIALDDGLLNALTATAFAAGLPLTTLGLQIARLPPFKKLKRVQQYENFNLLAADARALVSGRSDSDVLELNPTEAARFIEVDPGPHTSLVGEGPYVVPLGDHRVAMLNSSMDAGMPDNELDVLKVKIFNMGLDKENFVGNAPNSEGVTEENVNWVAQKLHDTPANGLFILGIHAPLLNPKGDYVPYFFRESQRASQAGQELGFFLSKGDDDKDKVGSGEKINRNLAPEQQAAAIEKVRAKFPEWFQAQGNSQGATFVKRGKLDDLLKSGVSSGWSEDLLRLLSGIGSARKADVILSGHDHTWSEFRVALDPATGEPIFHADFYTRNPSEYYPTRFLYGWRKDGSDPAAKPVTAVTYVEVDAKAQPDERPIPLDGSRKYKFGVRIPPYPDPLSHTADPRAWWAKHRPLALQTGALGPLKESQVPLCGFRVLSIKNNVIDKIHYITSERLEQSGYTLPWEEAIRLPDISGSRFRREARSVMAGAPAAASAVAALAIPGSAITNVVYRSGDGHLYEVYKDSQRLGYTDLTAAAPGSPAAKGNPFYYYNPAGRMNLVPYRGADDHIHTLHWTTGGVSHDGLSQVAGAPKAAGDPTGYYLAALDTHHILYRGGNGHLFYLYWNGSGRVRYEDLTALAQAAPAVGDPQGFLDTRRGQNIVVYRGTDGHVHDLYWSTGEVRHEGLSAFARAPQAAGNPVGYYTDFNDAYQVVYRGVDNHIHELWWHGQDPVRHTDLTAMHGGAPAVSELAAYCNRGSNTKHVVYRSEDNHLHEIWWFLGGSGGDSDLTIIGAAPAAADQASAFSIEGPNTQHVFYRGADNGVYGIRWA